MPLRPFGEVHLSQHWQHQLFRQTEAFVVPQSNLETAYSSKVQELVKTGFQGVCDGQCYMKLHKVLHYYVHISLYSMFAAVVSTHSYSVIKVT